MGPRVDENAPLWIGENVVGGKADDPAEGLCVEQDQCADDAFGEIHVHPGGDALQKFHPIVQADRARWHLPGQRQGQAPQMVSADGPNQEWPQGFP